ncbi:MAG: DUF975 family protein [Firmicutes bacterium]|nr:DUF975 family protein [Bacillota bacterium]
MIFESKHQARADIKGKVLQGFFAIILVSIFTSFATFLVDRINPFPTPVLVIGQNFWEQANAYSPEFLPGTIFNLVTSIGLSFFFVSVLSIGLNNFFIRNRQEKKIDVMTSLFMGFRLKYSLILKTLLSVFVALAIYIVPLFAMMVARLLFAFTSPILGTLISVLVLVGYIFLIIKVLDYALVTFLLADEDVVFESPKEYLEASKKMMKGYKFEFILLGFTFILWFFASLFTVFLLLIWLLPYVFQSYANFYLNLKPKPQVENVELEIENVISE